MLDDNTDIEKQKYIALSAIKRAFGTKEDESGATLFVSLHLSEIKKEYWQNLLGTADPSPAQVLDVLELQSCWGDERGLSTFDFTLPHDVTNYVISVRFNKTGDVAEITMES